MTIHNHGCWLLVVKNKPQYQRQEQISHSPEEKEGWLHSIKLRVVLPEDKNNSLSYSKREGDYDVCACDKRIYFNFGSNSVPARVNFLAQFVN